MTIQYIYYTDNIRLCKNGDIQKNYKKNNEWNVISNNSDIKIHKDKKRTKKQLYNFCFNHQFGLPINSLQRTMNWKFYEDNNIDY